MLIICHFQDCTALLGYCKKRYSKCWTFNLFTKTRSDNLCPYSSVFNFQSGYSP